MSELIVIGYETPERAEEARADLMTMAREYLVDVADAVAAVVDDEGNVKLNQMVNLWTAGAAGGAFWGLLVGMIFFNPLLGAAVGAGAGALSGTDRPEVPAARGSAALETFCAILLYAPIIASRLLFRT
ncbi:DUF1269 domain-containing protein [Heliomarina baculiformis]|uniref:DUF1269 domain-containing protein n=1 Tax=Heliomarina baculiformis TaxID=2872036 RepID=UPI001EE2B76E|nr:DUF1269 domain-containing protein [Heliomarina baculiformis]